MDRRAHRGFAASGGFFDVGLAGAMGRRALGVTQFYGPRFEAETFFDNVSHETLITILSKRITDKRFLHLIGQFLKAGYVEDWRYHQTYSGVPQGGNLSPLLANLYLNELDQAIITKMAMFNKGKARKESREYRRISRKVDAAKKQARRTGEWTAYKALRKLKLQTLSGERWLV